MKFFKFGLIVLAVLALAIGPSQAVQAAGPSGNWVSGIACQNLDTTDTNGASVQLVFYPEMSGT